ncbi:MAG: hypothetical protein EAZ95_02210 [Bacteroidetes bacterium]|nr:MAG: hypothetical protein EAZ95_02210 [Bacteroidota bacterium]
MKKILTLFCLSAVWLLPPAHAQHKAPSCLNLVSGNGGSSTTALANSNNQIFFSGSDATTGIEPRLANCNVHGIVANVVAGTSGSNPRYFTFYNGLTYYHANNGSASGLYATTGVALNNTLGKQLTTTIPSQANSILYGGMVKAGNYLYFTAQDALPANAVNNATSAYNVELWQSDGTSAGTVQVADINTTVPDVANITPFKNGSSFPQSLTPMTIGGVDYLFFTADESFVQRSSTQPSSSAVTSRIDSLGNRELYVRLANAPATTPSTKIEINTLLNNYVETCTQTGSTAIPGGLRYNYNCTYTITTLASSFPVNLTPFNGKLYFIATDNGITGLGAGSGDKLWSSNGTAIGTTQVPLPSGTVIDRRSKMAVSNNILYFVAHTATTGRELWKFDGVNASIVQDYNPGVANGVIGATTSGTNVLSFDMIDINGTLYFAGNNGTSGIELCKTDGTSISIIDINPSPSTTDGIADGITSSFPRKMANVNGVLYFFITGSLNLPQLWRHVPVDACSSLFPDNQKTAPYYVYSTGVAGTNEVNFGQITPVGNDFYFILVENTFGGTVPEPWYSESCPTVSVNYGTGNTVCGASSVSPAITFTKTSLQACAPAVTTPTDICPLGDCFCAPTLGGAINTTTGIVDLTNPSATSGIHKITYYYKDGASSCVIPVVINLNIQSAVSADIIVEPIAGDGTLGNTNSTQFSSKFRFSSTLTPTASTDDSNISTAFSPDGTKMYIADEFNHRIRQLDFATGNVTTLAGSISGFNDDIGTGAAFRNPSGVATDAVGNIYVADKGNHLIRKINPATAEVTTIAGVVGLLSGGYSDNNNPLLATFAQPSDVVVDELGNIYVSDKNNHAIRKIATSGVVTTVAGGSGAGFVNGTGTGAKFSFPAGIDLDLNGDILVADRLNHSIRRVTPTGVVTTVAGTGVAGNTVGATSSAQFNFPNEVVMSAFGKMYVADGGNNRIKEIDGTTVAHYAGDGTVGYQEGTALNARFSTPVGISEDPSGRLYVTDRLNVRIRRVKLNNAGGQINGSTTVCSGANTGVLTLVNYPGAPIATGIARWESSTNAGTTWTNLGNGGSATYNYTNLTLPTIFRVIVSESACGTIRSDIATINVIVPPTPTVTPVGVCGTLPASNVNATLTASGGTAGDYRWYDNADVLQPTLGQNATASVQVSVTTTFKVSIMKGTCESVKVPVTVTVYPPPTPSVTGTATVCSGTTHTYNTTANTGFRYKWEITGTGSYIVQAGNPNQTYEADNANSISVVWGDAGVGTVKVTETSPAPASCAGTPSTLNVTINATPALQVIAPTSPTGDAICHNASQTYSITTTNSVLWSVDNPAKGTFSSNNTPSTTFTGINTGTTPITATITVVETTGSSCSRTHTRTITINPLPADKTITGTSPVCVNATQNYSYTPSLTNTSVWSITPISGGNGTINSGGTTSSVNITWTTDGSANLCVTETDANGCSKQHCRTITINPLPTAQTITGAASVCVNTAQTYTVPQVGSNTYTWNVTTGTATPSTGTGTSFTPTFSSIGAGRICVTETNPTTTCSVTYCLDINVNDLPTTQTIIGTTTVCLGAMHTYSVTNTGNTFNWLLPTGGTLSSTNTASTNIAWNTLGTHTITLEETNGNSCKRANTLSVTVIALPNPPVLSPITATCAGRTVTYTATGGAGTLQWGTVTNGSVVSTTANTITVLWDNVTAVTTGVVRVREIGVAPANCQGQETVQSIAINPNPVTPTVTPTADVCVNSPHTYNVVSPTAGSTYAWTVVGGTPISGTGTSLAITWGATAGVGKISIIETNSNGCSSPATPVAQDIAIKALPTVPVITPTSAVCAGNPITYTVSNPTTGSTYTWTITGASPNIASGTGTSLAITWGAQGTGNIKIEETNATGCVGASLNQSIAVNATPAPPTISPIATSVCAGSTIIYTATGSTGTFEWEVNNNGTITTSTGNTVTVTWANVTATTAGEVKVREITPAPASCQGAYRVQAITINPLPTKQNIVGATTVCANTTNSYSLPTNNPTSTYQWKLNGTNVATGNPANIPAGTGGTLTVEETDANGCKQTHDNAPTPFVINVIPLPTPTITGANNNICANSTQAYTVATPNVANHYTWTITGGEILPLGTGQTKAGVGLTGIQIVWNNTTSGTIVVTETTPAPTSCARTSTIYNVTLTLSPTAQAITGTSVVGTIANVCPNSVHTYSVPNNPANSFTWTVQGGSILNGSPITNGSTITGTGTQSISVTWGTAGAGSINLVESTPAPSSCASTASLVTVSINPAPTPQTITGANSVCQGGTHTYTVANNASNSFAWVVEGGDIQGPGVTTTTNGSTRTGVGLQSVMIVWRTTVTAGKIDITETTPANCGSSAPSTLNITVNPTPKITAINATPTGDACGKSVVTYTIAGTDIAGASVVWEAPLNGTAPSLTGNSITITWNDVATTITERLKVRATSPAPASCVGLQFEQNFVINALPAVQDTTLWASPVCVNSTVTYTASAAGQWTVTGGTINSGQGTNSINVSWGTLGNGEVCFEETNATTGCKRKVCKTIKVNTTPTVSVNDIIGNTTVCANGLSTFSINNPNGYTVIWTIVGGTPEPPSTINSNPITVRWGASPVSIAVRLSAGTCEATSAPKAVNGVTAPVVTFTPINAEICLRGCNAFSAPNPPVGQVYEYEWLTDIAGTISSGKNDKVMTACWNVSNGTEYVRLKITIAGTNCSSISDLPASPTDLGFVKVNPLPAPDITGDDMVCPNEVVTYTTPNVAGNTYVWELISGGTATTATNTNAVTVTWGVAGSARLILRETTTATGCFKRDTLNVTIMPKPALPTASDRFVCNPPKVVDLSATTAGATNYVWYDAPNAGNVVATTQIFSPNITGDVSYWVVAINAAGCESDRKEVKVTANPSSTNLVINSQLFHADSCVATGDSPSGDILLTLVGNNGPYTFSWTKDGNTISNATEDLIGITKGNYQVVITDAGGCTTTSPVYTILEQLKTLQNPEIVYNGKVLADDEQIIVAQGMPTSLKAQAVDAVKFEWRDGTGTVVGTAQTLTITPQQQGDFMYNVTISNSKSCSAVRKVKVKVVGMNHYVPNVFSPNNDNQNDRLQVYGTGIKAVSFRVYNRLGEVVYETDKWVEGQASDNAIGWDGFYKGKLQDSGNYTWLMSVTYINDTTEKKTGNVYLKY